MTSRERLLRTLSGEVPDRVPISTYELCGFNAASFENAEPSYRALMDHIRAHTDAVTMWNEANDALVALTAHPTECTVREYVEGRYAVRQRILRTPDGDLTETTKRAPDVMTVWITEHLCKCFEDLEAVLRLPYREATPDFSDYARIHAETGDHGILMGGFPDPLCMLMDLMEFGEGTVCALTDLDRTKAILDEFHRRNMRYIEACLGTQVLDLYRIFGPEYATPPYMPPVFFEKLVYPYLCEMTALIHRHGGKVRIHSHGKVRQVLGYIADTGADAIDPCEAPPDGDISLREVKQRVGGRMTVFGNLQLKLLEHATTQEVRMEVARCMDSAKAGGRYIIMPTAAPISIPLSPATQRNYQTFIDTALELGAY